MSDSTSTVDRLAKSAQKRLDSTTAGTGVLTAIIILSGILSAVFFWRHSAAVFAGLPVAMATVLGLAIGLLPSEGAFFGWKRIRATKTDMTAKQVSSSSYGLWAAVGFAVTNVIAIFVTSFADLPMQVQQLSGWIAFFALMLPIPVQFILYARFVINEQSTVENHLQARLSAMSHAAYIRVEEARTEATIRGIEAEMNARLAAYGQDTGKVEADRVLTDGRKDVVGRFYEPVGKNTQKAAGSEPTRVPVDSVPARNGSTPVDFP